MGRTQWRPTGGGHGGKRRGGGDGRAREQGGGGGILGGRVGAQEEALQPPRARSGGERWHGGWWRRAGVVLAWCGATRRWRRLHSSSPSSSRRKRAGARRRRGRECEAEVESRAEEGREGEEDVHRARGRKASAADFTVGPSPSAAGLFSSTSSYTTKSRACGSSSCDQQRPPSATPLPTQIRCALVSTWIYF